jgi:hypothetical protein
MSFLKTSNEPRSGKILRSGTPATMSGKHKSHPLPDPNNRSVLLDGFEDRWAEFNLPLSCSAALVKCLLTIGVFKTHDPIVLHRNTGYPLRFINRLISGLMRSGPWLCFGYEELQSEIRDMPDDPNNIDELLCYFMEQCWHDPAVDFAALEQEWSYYMGSSTPP